MYNNPSPPHFNSNEFKHFGSSLSFVRFLSRSTQKPPHQQTERTIPAYTPHQQNERTVPTQTMHDVEPLLITEPVQKVKRQLKRSEQRLHLNTIGLHYFLILCRFLCFLFFRFNCILVAFHLIAYTPPKKNNNITQQQQQKPPR